MKRPRVETTVTEEWLNEFMWKSDSLIHEHRPPCLLKKKQKNLNLKKRGGGFPSIRPLSAPGSCAVVWCLSYSSSQTLSRETRSARHVECAS